MATTDKNALKESLDKLMAGIVTDPQKLMQFTRAWTGGFRQYSLYNTLLILIQKPNSTLLAGYHQWLDRGRQVKLGAKAIKIYAPIIIKKQSEIDPDAEPTSELVGYRVVNVFDVSDTDGKPIELGAPQYVIGQTDLTIDLLSKIFPEYNVQYQQTALDNGHTDGHTITLTESHNINMVATYIHELAHCMMHFKDNNNTLFVESSELSRDVMELQAECVAYIVGLAYGIDNQQAAYYLASWHADADAVAKYASVIINTAEKIIKRIELHKEGQ